MYTANLKFNFQFRLKSRNKKNVRTLYNVDFCLWNDWVAILAFFNCWVQILGFDFVMIYKAKQNIFNAFKTNGCNTVNAFYIFKVVKWFSFAVKKFISQPKWFCSSYLTINNCKNCKIKTNSVNRYLLNVYRHEDLNEKLHRNH